MIEQIIVPVPEEEQSYICPICLDYPLVPKLTLCGHLFCWTCLLRYIEFGGKKWRSCPICFESILGSELKSVKLNPKKSQAIENKFTFILMHRCCHLDLLVPVAEPSSALLEYPLNDTSAEYSKAILVSPKFVIENVIEAEFKELVNAASKDENSEIISAIENAQTELSVSFVIKRVIIYLPCF